MNMFIPADMLDKSMDKKNDSLGPWCRGCIGSGVELMTVRTRKPGFGIER